MELAITDMFAHDMAAVRSLVVLQVERLVIEVQKGTSVGQRGVVHVVENPMSLHQGTGGRSWDPR